MVESSVVPANFVISNAEASLGYPEGVGLIVFDQTVGDIPAVPIFDVRRPTHHQEIAKRIANIGMLGVVHGIGLYGAIWAVEKPSGGTGESQSAKPLERFKPDRSKFDKIPIFLRPKEIVNVVDLDAIHEEFRPYFASESVVEKLYNEATAIHFVIPVDRDDPGIDPIFITYPEDWSQKNVDTEQHRDAPTISAFSWYDPMFDDIAKKMSALAPDVNIAISSFNRHGEEPAWDFDGLIEYLNNNLPHTGCPFDYVVIDPLINDGSVGSSFAQIAPPLIGEDPLWRVYRTGPTNFDKYLERIGSKHGYKVVRGAKEAARKPSLQNEDLDDRMLEIRRLIDTSYKNK